MENGGTLRDATLLVSKELIIQPSLSHSAIFTQYLVLQVFQESGMCKRSDMPTKSSINQLQTQSYM